MHLGWEINPLQSIPPRVLLSGSSWLWLSSPGSNSWSSAGFLTCPNMLLLYYWPQAPVKHKAAKAQTEVGFKVVQCTEMFVCGGSRPSGRPRVLWHGQSLVAGDFDLPICHSLLHEWPPGPRASRGGTSHLCPQANPLDGFFCFQRLPLPSPPNPPQPLTQQTPWPVRFPNLPLGMREPHLHLPVWWPWSRVPQSPKGCEMCCKCRMHLLIIRLLVIS